MNYFKLPKREKMNETRRGAEKIVNEAGNSGERERVLTCSHQIN